MRSFGLAFYRSLLVSAAIAFTSAATAQTLKHRPPATPDPPVMVVRSGANAEMASAPPILPEGTNLQVETTRHYPMKVNEAIEGRLLHPIYFQGKLAIPDNTLLHGKIIALEPDTKARWRARLRGDFTPFHTVQLQFYELELPTGALAVSSGIAANGAPVLLLAASGATRHQSFLSRYWTQAKSRMHDRVAYFTAPGLGDRALLVLYHQLPFHPERIDTHTMWSFDLTAPLVLPDLPVAAPLLASAAPAELAKQDIWSVYALLIADLSSATAMPGDPVRALVVEPVFDRDRQLVVPQGTVLVGKVSEAHSARSFGRNGKLRFTFQQMRFPAGPDRAVQGSLASATAESQQALSLDTEGTITPRNQSSAIAPLLLTMLAGRALDDDGNITAQTGVASNGFGLVGRVVGVATGNRNIAAGIGYYAAALSFYDNFLSPGRNVIFPRNTRIVIETTPLRAPVLKPGESSEHP